MEAKLTKESDCIVKPPRLVLGYKAGEQPWKTTTVYPVSELASISQIHGDMGVMVRNRVVTMVVQYYEWGLIVQEEKTIRG